jgi:hypothetical protein
MKLIINNHTNINNIREFGTLEYTIQIRHMRPKEVMGRGVTILSAISNKSPMPRIYVSECVEGDQFCRRTGIIICIQRLAWELIDKKSVIDYYNFEEGGKTIKVGISNFMADYPHAKEEFFTLMSNKFYSQTMPKDLINSFYGA